MNKKIITITILSIVTGLLILNLVKTKDSEVEKMPKQVKNTNMLTMMLETEAGTGSYEEVTQSEWPQDGYVFNASLSRCENGGSLSWDDNAKKIILNTDVSDKCYVYFDIYNEPTFAEYIINNVYTEDGVNGLYYHDGIGTYTNASEEAGDNSYRYSGANPNNYVCFGSDETACPNDNLYRIIGLFDDDKDGNYNIKLIKNTNLGYFAWNSGNDNTWNATIKPDIYTTLNESYYNALSSEWQSLINENQIWQVGGMNWTVSNTAKQYYGIEVGNDQIGFEETMAIGLMYVSDYGYAASPENWQTALYSYNNVTIKNNNWLYLGDFDWTISRSLNFTGDAFIVNYTGYTYINDVDDNYAIRPVFYLKSNATLMNGMGTSSDPYHITN